MSCSDDQRGSNMTTKITTRRIDQPKWVPALWQIMVDGQDFEGGRVLKMGRRYLAVYDGKGVANHGSFEKRSEAAQHVVRFAK